MARKHIVYSYKMMDADTMAADITSDVVEVSQMDSAAILVEWTATTPNGVLEVYARHGDAGTWYLLDFNSTITVTATNSFVQILLNSLPFTHVKLFYDRTSGTGSMTATITAKTAGG